MRGDQKLALETDDATRFAVVGDLHGEEVDSCFLTSVLETDNDQVLPQKHKLQGKVNFTEWKRIFIRVFCGQETLMKEQGEVDLHLCWGFQPPSESADIYIS